ncbi:transaldolase [Rhizobium leguminosarum]|nr:transaldolase [Rhizobium leguminosarum]MBB6292817.1 transaldolase [Rhizobium leguminosarum]MBY5876323.1 hypothetical protein [Rhizobium leguminosarum]NEI16100.1 hypothetical protein [Rhizobium ruizarguesonis]
MDKLAQLRQMTTVVADTADTADVEAVKRLKPMDCTTNPTIVLQALKTPICDEDFEEAFEWGSKASAEGALYLRRAVDVKNIWIPYGD